MPYWNDGTVGSMSTCHRIAKRFGYLFPLGLEKIVLLKA